MLVCGSREWGDPREIRMALYHCWLDGYTRVVHGDARGADTIADQIARGLSFEVRAYPADWQCHGKRAGVLRNIAMLDVEAPDLVLAFGRGRGTDHTVTEATRRGIPVKEVGRA